MTECGQQFHSILAPLADGFVEFLFEGHVLGEEAAGVGLPVESYTHHARRGVEIDTPIEDAADTVSARKLFPHDPLVFHILDI